MAATKWTIRNYNAFIREARHSYNAPLPVAREMYRQMRGQVNRPVRAIDLIRHPRYANKAIAKADEIIEKAKVIEAPPGFDLPYWINNYTEDWDDYEPITFEGMYETTSD